MADKTVRVELVGGTEQFQRAFKAAGASTGDLQKGVKSLEGSLKGIGTNAAASLGPVGGALSAIGPAGLVAAAGIGAAAAALGAMVGFLVDATRGLVALGGKLTDLAAQTGLTTTTLQELQYAGSLVGVSMEEAGNAVGKMQKAIVAGDTVFARLGLNLEQIRKLDVAGQFDAVAVAIKSIKDPTQQTAAAMEAFGRGGAAILPLIKSDLAGAREEAHRLGIVLSEETVAAADALGDKATKLEAAWDGFKNQIAAVIVNSGLLHTALDNVTSAIGEMIAPVVQNQDALALLFREAVKDAGAFAAKLKEIILIGAAMTGGPLVGFFGEQLKKAFADAAAAVEKLQAQINLKNAAKAGAGAGGDAFGGPGKTFIGKGDEAAGAKAQAERERRETAYAALKKSMEAEFLRQIKERDKAEKDFTDSVKAQRESVIRTTAMTAKAMEGLASEAQKLANVDPGMRLLKAIEELGPTAVQAAASMLELADEVARLQALGPLTTEQLENVRAKIAELQAQGAGKLPKTLEGVVDKTKDWVEALDTAAGVLSQLGDTDLGNLISQFSQLAKQARAIQAQIEKGGPKGAGWSGMSTGGKFQTGAAVGGAAIGIAMDAYSGANTDVAKSTAKGALTGAAKGAMIGSIVPGIGTAVGAVVGGVIGGVAGFLGSKKKIKEMLKGYDDALIQQFGSLEKAKKAADKYGIALGKALDSKKPKEIQAAMEKLNKALEKRANLEQGLMTAQGNVETLQDLTKAIDNPLLKAAVQALATKVSDELAKAGLGFAATGPLRDSAEFGAAQNIAGAAAGTVAGLRQAGVVDQGVLDAAAGVASEVQKQAFDAAKAAGMDDAAATKASLGAISPLLREQLNASIASGRKLDAKVQEQIDLAKANGIDILADPAIEAVGVQKDILAAIKGQGQRDLGTNLLDARDRFGGEKSGIPSHAKGIGFVPFTGPKLLHRGETVLPANFQMPTMRSVSGMNASSAALGNSSSNVQNTPVTVNLTVNGAPNMSPAEFQTRVERAVETGVRLGAPGMTTALDRNYRRL